MNDPKPSQPRRGFTIVELLVASAVFIAVAAVAVALFTSAVRSQRKIVAIQDVDDNARFLAEFVAREVRMSAVGPGQDGQRTTLSITRMADGRPVLYAFAAGGLTRTFRGETLAVSGDTVDVEGFFDVRGSGTGDGAQPVVTMVFNVRREASQLTAEAEVALQVTVTQRQPQEN